MSLPWLEHANGGMSTTDDLMHHVECLDRKLDVTLSSTPVDLTVRVVECLRHTLPKGSRVAIFGSRARGDAASDSDIDLLVLEPEITDRRREMARLSRLLGWQLIPADVVVMSTRAFEAQRDVVNSLAWRVMREGQWHEFPA